MSTTSALMDILPSRRGSEFFSWL